MKKGIWLLILFVVATRTQAQTVVSFRFSLNPPSSSELVAGWISVTGDPFSSVRTASDPTTGISISSVHAANWFVNGDVGAADGIGEQNASYFPVPILASGWMQQGGAQAQFNAAVPQLEISGLNPDSVYYIKMSASNIYGQQADDPTQYTVSGASMLPSQFLIVGQNLTSGITFQHVAPDANGKIRVYVNTTSTSDWAQISGLQIISGSAQIAMPTVHITSPANNDILAEESSIVINATATETGGSITKVEFFAGDVKIGESTTAPYSVTWVNPDAGHYLITTKATDGTGTTNTATINLAVESLTSFWSMTGNIHMNPDSNFIGNVDSVRLAFRTKNIERMSISPLGDVTVASSKADSVNHPALRVYHNGDLAAGTTMDRSVYTGNQTGLRYYAKPGYLQLGGSDRLDTTQNPIVYGNWPSSGIFINSDSANTIKGKIMNTVFAADESSIDSGVWMEDNFIAGEKLHFNTGAVNTIRSFISGYNTSISAPVSSATINGQSLTISKPVSSGIIVGYGHVTQDTSYSSFIAGDHNSFGGLYQVVAGQHLVNRSPFGVTFGSSNVDFSTQGYTGLQALQPANIPGISGRPLFALGNGLSNDASVHSNAITVLFNGRTQINTTGMSNTLAQTDVTPKAALDVVSTNTGVLLPRLTNAQRNAIVSGDLQNGLLLYNTDSSVFQYYNGSAWNSVGSGGGGASGHWLFAGGTQYDTVNNIGIGTSNTQGYKLAVNGTAIFTKIKVKSVSNWPDFVFRKDYRLPGLPELEQYLNEHHHLPGIASEQEVMVKGIDVADHEAALLKKVEELTLYLIAENKRLTEQIRKMEDEDNRLEKQQQTIDLQNARLDAQQKQIDELKALILEKNKQQ